MAKIKCDRRKLEYEPRPDVHARLLTRHPDWVRMELDLAKDFAAILESRHYYDEDCAGLVEYARKFRYDGRRAMGLARLGQALTLEPALEEAIVAGRIPLESGPVLYDALCQPTIRSKADWLDLAGTLSPGGLRGYVKRLKEAEARGTEDLRVLRLFVTDKDRDDFRRLSFVVQVKEKRTMTEGEVFAFSVNDTLDRHDPLRKAQRAIARRAAKGAAEVEDPAARQARLDRMARELGSRNRHLPADLVHDVVYRAEGRCEIPGCARKGQVELMHMVLGFAEGGDHHLRNNGLGCPRHHRLVDGGRIRCVGFTEDERPMFEDSKGRLLIPDARPPP